MANLIRCRTCGANIASNVKTCPQCGARVDRPFYKKWWFWLAAVFVFLWAIGRYGGKPSDTLLHENDVGLTTETARVDSATETQAEPERATQAEERASGLPSIAEQVVYEGHGVVITAKGMEKTGSDWNVNLLIENSSDLNLGFNAHAYAVNGIMTRESIYAMDCDVAAGKKVNAQLTLKGRFLQQFGIEDSEIGCIDVLFWAYDNDKYFKEFDTGQLEIKTSLYNGVHDRLVADTVFSESGISVDYVKSDRDEYTFAVSNDTGKYVSFTFDEISVNDYTVSSTDYDLYNETLLDGCQILCIVKVKSDFKEANGITTVQTLDWNIEIEPEDDWREEYKLGPVVYRVK